MKAKTLKKVMCLMLLALGVIAFQPAANAGPIQLMFYDEVDPLASPFTVDDNGVGDSNPLLNVITFADSIGDWLVNVTTGIEYVNGDPLPVHLDLSSANLSSNGGGALLVGLSGLWYSGLPWQFDVAGTTDGAVFFTVYADSGNTFFQGNVIDSSSPAGIPPSTSFSHTASGSLDPLVFTGPYSVSITALIVHDTIGMTSFDANVSVPHVPEPASLLLLGFGLLGLLAVRRFTNC